MLYSPALRSANIANLDSKRSLEHKKLREKNDYWLTIVTHIEDAIQKGSHSVVTYIPYDDFIEHLTTNLGYRVELHTRPCLYYVRWDEA